MAEHTPLPWSYRPNDYDDWGWIRAERRDDIAPLVAIAKGGSWQDTKTLDDHRRDKTDPYEANALFIVKAVNAHETLVRAAEHVCWFDWSNNDPDAVAAIDALRALVGQMKDR